MAEREAGQVRQSRSCSIEVLRGWTAHCIPATISKKELEMLTRFVLTLTACAASLVWAAPGFAQEHQQHMKQFEHSNFMRPSDLEGLNVFNTQNEKLGTIKELLVDVNSGKIGFIALSPSFKGTDGRLIPIPFDSVRIAFDRQSQKNYALVNLQPDQLVHAPQLKSGDWAAFNNTHYLAGVSKYFQDLERTAGRQGAERR